MKPSSRQGSAVPTSRRVLPIAVAAVLATGALATGARAQAPAPPTITASGTAQVEPKPQDRNDEASIRTAVDAANAKALPRAVADARRHAADLAAAAGLHLGALLSISDSPTAVLPYFISFQNGTFGEGHFCGRIRNTKTVVGSNGVRRRVATKGTHKICRVPPYVVASVSLTFATG